MPDGVPSTVPTRWAAAAVGLLISALMVTVPMAYHGTIKSAAADERLKNRDVRIRLWEAAAVKHEKAADACEEALRRCR